MICFTLAVLFLGLKYYFAFLTASARVIGNFSPEFGFPPWGIAYHCRVSVHAPITKWAQVARRKLASLAFEYKGDHTHFVRLCFSIRGKVRIIRYSTGDRQLAYT